MPVYAQLPYFGVERLSGNTQFNGGAGWTPNHAFGFPESGFEDLSFVLNKVSNQRSSRCSQSGSHVREPGLIYKESLPFRQNHRPLDYILQLPDVAGPIICVEEFDRLLVYVSNLLAQFLGVAIDQVSDQQGNIANALAQCWQSNRNNVEAIKQVLTERAFSYRLSQVSIRSGYHPYVNGHCLSAAHSLEFTLLKNSQQRDLRLWRKIAYFIEEYRSTVGRFETSQPALSSPCKGTFFVAEQFGSNQRLGNRRAIHSNESTV